MIEVAQKYKDAGFSCLPTQKDKSPAISAWKGVEIAPALFTSYGIGIKCGASSGNLECMDFDNHFGDAKEVISAFMKIEGVQEIYEKYRLPIETSMRGGFHLLYRCETIEGNKKLALRPIKRDGKLGRDVLIETRGEGGYFVAAPTPGYQVIKNDICNVAYITPGERGVLLSAARYFNEWVDSMYQTTEDKEKPGNRFNDDPASIEEMKDALITAGWVDVGAGKWRRPGKSEGITATLGKAAEKIFYNFSDAAYPFDAEKGYTAFQVVGLLKYDGDFKRFAGELAERYQMNKKTEAYIGKSYTEKKEETTEEIDQLLLKSKIDFNIPVSKPPVIMKIKTQIGTGMGYSRVFTLGNFSAITGKSKSKKTFLTSMFIAAALKGGYFGNIFESDLPDGRRGVLLFDTEQSSYDAYITAKRVPDMLGFYPPLFMAYDMREFSPLERCKLIERAIDKAKNDISFVVIDGIADLAMAINDEIEASRVVSLLMKWTKLYNVHIQLVIHQNKNDEYATGHLGSAILKKAECIISVKKDLTNTMRSEVSCNLIRGAMDFDTFSFLINEYGLPVVDEDELYFKDREMPRF